MIDALAVDWSDVTMLDKIGSGAFGDIWKCRWRGTLVAAKMLKGGLPRTPDVTPSDTHAVICKLITAAKAEKAEAAEAAGGEAHSPSTATPGPAEERRSASQTPERLAALADLKQARVRG